MMFSVRGTGQDRQWALIRGGWERADLKLWFATRARPGSLISRRAVRMLAAHYRAARRTAIRSELPYIETVLIAVRQDGSVVGAYGTRRA
jgi:hypothetical protein